MDEKVMGKTSWIEQLDSVARDLEAIAAEATAMKLNAEDASGSWSFKDVVSHLNGWRRLSADRLEAAAADREQPPFPWPDHLREESEDDVDEINRYFYERDRDRPAEEVIAESDDMFRRMRLALEVIPEEDLVTPGRYSWLRGLPLSAVVAGSIEHFRIDHEAELREFISRDG